MKHRKRRRARKLFMIGALMAASTCMMAQDTKRERPSPEQMREKSNARFEKMVNSIPELTADQKSKLYGIHEKYQVEAMKNAEAHRQNRLTADEREKLSSDEKKEHIDRKAKAQADRAKRRIDMQDEVAAVLTADQLEYLKQKRAERREKAKERKRGRGPGPRHSNK